MPSRSFTAFPLSVPAARGFVAEVLEHLPADLRETAALLASELVTNAVRHAGGRDFEISVRYPSPEGRLWIGVSDCGQGDPVIRTPDVTAEGGRGIQLVGLLADRWGVRRERGGDVKTVWFELSLPGGAVLPPQERRELRPSQTSV